jgi:hypothetical protein
LHFGLRPERRNYVDPFSTAYMASTQAEADTVGLAAAAIMCKQTGVNARNGDVQGRLSLLQASRFTELKCTGQSPTFKHPRPSLTFESEHGHKLSRISPMTRHPAESVLAWFNGLFTTVIGISTLGASITFNYVIGNSNSPAKEGYFSPREVQLFLGISWLLFLLSLASASLGSTILTFFKDHWKKDWNGEHGKTSQRDVQLYATFATTLLAGLVVSAFMFLCLVVAAYTPIIGWIALGFTAAFGLVCAIGVMYQVPWPWQSNQPKVIATD